MKKLQLTVVAGMWMLVLDGEHIRFIKTPLFDPSFMTHAESMQAQDYLNQMCMSAGTAGIG